MLFNNSVIIRAYFYVIALVWGMCMGSFLNCAAYRMCHGISIAKGRSKCDSCGHILGPKDLVPVFSYIFSKGKCRYCGASLSPIYVISEIVSGIAFLFIVLRFGWTLSTIELLILVSLMLCASFADLEDCIIPDILVILGIVNRVIFILLSKNILSELKQSAIGGFCVAVPLYLVVIVMEKILKKEAMGGGDLKLVFMLGLYVSIGQSLLAILIACFSGIIFAYASKKAKQQFPFGPSLCLGYYITLFFGEAIIASYLSLF